MFARIWSDDSGSLLAAEYLLLSAIVITIVAFVAASVRDGIESQAAEFGAALKKVDRSPTPPVKRSDRRIDDRANPPRFVIETP